MPSTSIFVAYSLFVDDTLLFGHAVVQEAKEIKKVLDLYTTVSEQRISAPKSKVYIFFTNALIVSKIVKILGFQQELLPSVYLGVPFFIGSNKAGY